MYSIYYDLPYALALFAISLLGWDVCRRYLIQKTSSTEKRLALLETQASQTPVILAVIDQKLNSIEQKLMDQKNMAQLRSRHS